MRQDQKISISVRDLSKGFWLRSHNNSFRGFLSGLIRKKTPKRKQALQHISFDIYKGECLGIIGRNGSGKSTLLKILSQIIKPDAGSAILEGKVASLLEVGVGFYPDLTGRENVYMSGGLLGMSRIEIDGYLEDIVSFAEIGEYLDVPVRYYSSGMYVRLGFAVASFLQQDILIIDEVLAVGDLRFKQKCMTRMRSLFESGKTLLLVSHNLEVIHQLCDRTMLLEDGKIKFIGPTEQALEIYTSPDLKSARVDPYIKEVFSSQSEGIVNFTIIFNSNMKPQNYQLHITWYDSQWSALTILDNLWQDQPIGDISDTQITCQLAAHYFFTGSYYARIELWCEKDLIWHDYGLVPIHIQQDTPNPVRPQGVRIPVTFKKTKV